MKQKGKFRLLVGGALLFAGLLVGCAVESNSERIVGRWIYEVDNNIGFEFYSDGSGVGFNGNEEDAVTWSISEDETVLELANPFGSDVLTLTIDELTDNQLILSSGGEEMVLLKD